MTTLVSILITALTVYNVIILIRVILSWVPTLGSGNPTGQSLIRFIHDATEPVLAPIRSALPQNIGIDFSPLIVLVGINILTGVLRAAV